MTTELAPVPRSQSGPDRGAASTLWAAPLWAHALVLGVVLAVCLPIFGSDGRFMSDEGAALAQARAFADGDLTVPNRADAIDPDMEWFAFAKSWVGEAGGAPYPKKVLYPLLVTGAVEVGGVDLAVGLSMFALVAASSVAAVLSREVRPGLERATLWVCAVSPLFVDSLLVMGHTIGALAAVAATWGAFRCRTRVTPGAVAAIVASIFLAVLLRNEATLFGIVLAIVVFVRPGDRAAVGRGVAALVAGTTVGATVASIVLDRAFFSGSTIYRSDSGVGDVPEPGVVGLLDDRVTAFDITWFGMDDRASWTGALLVVVLLLGLALVVVATRTSTGSTTVVVLAAATPVLALARLAMIPSGGAMVSGLVVAFPLLVWGLVAVARRPPLMAGSIDLVAVSGGFALTVLATQYRVGGALEWGGRFFALALPVIAPVVALGLHHISRARDGRVAVGGLVAASVLITASGADAIRRHVDTNTFFEAAMDAVAATTDPGDDGPPIVVTTEEFVPRNFWRSSLDGPRVLVVEEADELPALLDALEAAGIEEIAVLTQEAPDVEQAVGDRLETLPGAEGRPADGVVWLFGARL